MEKDFLKETLEELTELYECYLHLNQWGKSENCKSKAAKSGQFAIIQRLRELLNHPDVLPIVAAREPYPLEDYIHYPETDTPVYIEKLRNHILN